MTFLLDHDVPDDIEFSLSELGHRVVKLREVFPKNALDEQVLGFAAEREFVLISCNRDDFLALAQVTAHSGLVILIRRRNRSLERTALVRLIDSAGESGLRGNINFA